MHNELVDEDPFLDPSDDLLLALTALAKSTKLGPQEERLCREVCELVVDVVLDGGADGFKRLEGARNVLRGGREDTDVGWKKRKILGWVAWAAIRLETIGDDGQKHRANVGARLGSDLLAHLKTIDPAFGKLGAESISRAFAPLRRGVHGIAAALILEAGACDEKTVAVPTPGDIERIAGQLRKYEESRVAR